MAILTGDYFTDLEEDNDLIEYTMFVSGLNYGGMRPLLEDADAEENIAIVFDAVTTHTLDLPAEKTSYPVEGGVSISDHVTIKDSKLSFTAHVTSAPVILTRYNIIDRDTDFEDPVASERPTKALEILRKIQTERKLITLTTEDAILTDYVITNLSARREANEGAKLVFDITVEEFRKVDVGRTVSVTTSDPKKAGKKNNGADSGSEGGKDEKEYKDVPNTLSKDGTAHAEVMIDRGYEVPTHKVEVPKATQ